jgi:hypothetical protein
MACLTNPISQPSLDNSSIWIPLISNEVSHLQRRSVWCDRSFIGDKIRFRSRVFRFYSTDGASSRYCMSLLFFSHFIALVLMHLVLLVTFVAQISTSFSISVPRMCVLNTIFIVYFLVITRWINLVSNDKKCYVVVTAVRKPLAVP